MSRPVGDAKHGGSTLTKIDFSRSRLNHALFGWTLLAALVLSSPRPAVAAEILLVVDQFPPYQYRTAGGDVRGSSHEVVQAVFDDLHIPIRIEFLPRKRAVLTTKRGHATGLFSSGHKKERESFVQYSDLISYATKGVIVKKSYRGCMILALKDLRNVSVGAVSGFAANIF